HSKAICGTSRATKEMWGTQLMVIQQAMFEIDGHRNHRPSKGGTPQQDPLEAENVSLRLLLAQAEIDAKSLLGQAGIDAREREASDKLQKLILEELHHRIRIRSRQSAPSSPRAFAKCKTLITRSTPSRAACWLSG